MWSVTDLTQAFHMAAPVDFVAEALGSVGQALIHQYIGAYGPNTSALPTLAQAPHLGAQLVDRARHALAFTCAPGPGTVLLPQLLRTLDLGDVRELG